MATRTSPAFKSTVLLVVYAACLCLVLSFILFEVLDVDGSDFPRPISRAVTVLKLAEPPHDFKRAWSDPLPHGWMPSSLRFETPRAGGLRGRTTTAPASFSAASPGRDRSTLARGSLSDAAPSA